MSKIELRLNNDQLIEMEGLFIRLPNVAEGIVNDILDTEGSKTIIQSMIKFTPRSKVNKKHAVDSNPYRGTVGKGNMTLYLYEKEAFGYLVFPEIGIGKRFANYNRTGFMADGVQAARDEVLNMIIKKLTDEINS